jgi:hypothetical protein
MSICADLICDLCQNRHVEGSVCFGCVDYDSFMFKADSLEGALERAQIAEAEMSEKLQGYMQENTHLRAKLNAEERHKQHWMRTSTTLVSWIRSSDERIKELKSICKEAVEIPTKVEHSKECDGNCASCKYAHESCTVGQVVLRLKAAGEENPVVSVTVSQPDEELFYIQDTRDYVGNDLLFWGKDGKGYTCHINQAGVYTKSEAIRLNQERYTDVLWPKSYIDARIGTSVDAQHVSIEEALAGTGIVLNEAPKQVTKPDHCWKCGKFVSKDRSTPECPHCDTDLSS